MRLEELGLRDKAYELRQRYGIGSV